MRDAFSSLGFDLLVLVGAALALIALLRAARWAIDVAPLRKERRAALVRGMPIAAALCGLFYLLLSARWLFSAEPGTLPFVLALVVAGFVAASWQAVRDVLSGVALRAGRVCQVGDHVRIGTVEGRVARMGYRVLVIETTEGDEAILPYSRVARDAVVRTRSLGGIAPHRFTLDTPARMSFAEASERIVHAALLHHWSAFVRQPEVIAAGDAIEVTVYALDPAYGPDIEASVRRELSRPVRPAASAGAQLSS